MVEKRIILVNWWKIKKGIPVIKLTSSPSHVGTKTIIPNEVTISYSATNSIISKTAKNIAYDGYGRVNGKDIYILAKYEGETDNVNKIHKDSPKNIDIERSQAIDEYFKGHFPVKVLHLSCYNAILKDKYIEVRKLYDMLPASEDAEDQGFFTDGIMDEIFKDY